MSEQERSYPLQWPAGWPRAKHRARAMFRTHSTRWVGDGDDLQRRREARALTVIDAIVRLKAELGLIGGKYSILSTNLELRLNGAPRSGQRPPEDPGAAVYFTLKDKRVVLACDKWDRPADNIAAIAAHIDALRGQERWGVGSLEQAFAGYSALPSPTQAKQWRSVLGLPADTKPGVWTSDALLAAAEARFRELAARHHPDIQGGSHEQMAELTQAIQEARKELRP